MKEQLQKAIGAHGLWKQRLRSAIATGKSEFTVSSVCSDNQCEFGKWLSNLSPADKKTPRFHLVQSHHADFHKEAARILELALAGKKQEAEQGLASSGRFEKLSAGLTLELMGWASESKG